MSPELTGKGSRKRREGHKKGKAPLAERFNSETTDLCIPYEEAQKAMLLLAYLIQGYAGLVEKATGPEGSEADKESVLALKAVLESLPSTVQRLAEPWMGGGRAQRSHNAASWVGIVESILKDPDVLEFLDPPAPPFYQPPEGKIILLAMGPFELPPKLEEALSYAVDSSMSSESQECLRRTSERVRPLALLAGMGPRGKQLIDAIKDEVAPPAAGAGWASCKEPRKTAIRIVSEWLGCSRSLVESGIGRTLSCPGALSGRFFTSELELFRLINGAMGLTPELLDACSKIVAPTFEGFDLDRIVFGAGWYTGDLPGAIGPALPKGKPGRRKGAPSDDPEAPT